MDCVGGVFLTTLEHRPTEHYYCPARKYTCTANCKVLRPSYSDLLQVSRPATHLGFHSSFLVCPTAYCITLYILMYTEQGVIRRVPSLAPSPFFLFVFLFVLRSKLPYMYFHSQHVAHCRTLRKRFILCTLYSARLSLVYDAPYEVFPDAFLCVTRREQD